MLLVCQAVSISIVAKTRGTQFWIKNVHVCNECRQYMALKIGQKSYKKILQISILKGPDLWITYYTFIAPKHWCCHSLKTYYTNSTITTTTDESGLSSKWAIRAQRVNAWQTSFRLAWMQFSPDRASESSRLFFPPSSVWRVDGA